MHKMISRAELIVFFWQSNELFSCVSFDIPYMYNKCIVDSLRRICVRSKLSTFHLLWCMNFWMASLQLRDNQIEKWIRHTTYSELVTLVTFQNDVDDDGTNSYTIIISRNVWWIVSLSVLCAIWRSPFSTTKKWRSALRPSFTIKLLLLIFHAHLQYIHILHKYAWENYFKHKILSALKNYFLWLLVTGASIPIFGNIFA